ncbi:MAG: hypothetical protein QOJ19_3906, partial [Acidimicrobiia bacterium]|nr:hypothetical protein [Acidimicrobiia bacterium]
APPARLTVTSSGGGSETVSLSARGRGFLPIPVRSFGGPDARVRQGQTVVLDGSGSSGDVSSYEWRQTAGPYAHLTGETTARPSFVAPNSACTLSFELTVQGPGGLSTDVVDIIVEDVTAPVASAGPDQTVIGGRAVTLDGTASTGASSYAWTQVSGNKAVNLTGADSAKPTFNFPVGGGALTFQVTASGPGGTATDTVTVTAVDDAITVTFAEFRSGKGDWRIEGTATVPGPGNSVTIRIGNSATGPILANVDVDALGNWAYRARNTRITPDATATISLTTTVGGQRLGAPLSVRR